MRRMGPLRQDRRAILRPRAEEDPVKRAARIAALPRAAARTKDKAGKPYTCDRCAEQIVAGERFYE